MKRKVNKKLFWQSLLSVFAFAAFVYLAIASGGVSQQKFDLGGGRWEMARYLGNGTTQIIRGPVDKKGLFEGAVKIDYEDKEYQLVRQEEVTMKAGERHGLSKMTDLKTNDVEEVCYQHGSKVDKKYCEKETEKAATIRAEDNSAYDIFSYKVPWYEFCLGASGYDSDYLMAYLDTLELVLYSMEFAEDEFDDYYEEVIEVLEETPYDSIISLNNEYSIYHGIDLIMRHEFRLATLDAYMEGDSNTFEVVESIYPNYLLYLNQLEVTDADFEEFCHEYDSIMSVYDPISPVDPYLLDSLDQRMIRTLQIINSDEDSTAVESQALKSAFVSSNKLVSIRTFQRDYLSHRLNKTGAISPQEVSDVILLTILENFIYGDLVLSAVKDAYTSTKGIVTEPTVITVFSASISSSSVTLEGNVIEDGGGEVTARGIAWEGFYNPSVENQVVSGGTGTGLFTATVSGLTEGETYYARAFATNSAGTAYGNCISFVAGGASGIEAMDVDNLDLQIYPNPASDQVTLSFKTTDTKGMVFSMYDLNGRLVLQKDLEDVIQGKNSISINLPELKSGMYTCRMEGEDKIHGIQKLMITR